MSRLTGLGALLSVAALAAACSTIPASRYDRVPPTLALAPGTAQFLAPSGLVLRRAGDGTVRIGSVQPGPEQAESRVVAPEARRALTDGASASVWTESIVNGYCVIPIRPASVTEAPPLTAPRSPLRN